MGILRISLLGIAVSTIMSAVAGHFREFWVRSPDFGSPGGNLTLVALLIAMAYGVYELAGLVAELWKAPPRPATLVGAAATVGSLAFMVMFADVVATVAPSLPILGLLWLGVVAIILLAAACYDTGLLEARTSATTPRLCLSSREDRPKEMTGEVPYGAICTNEVAEYAKFVLSLPRDQRKFYV